MAAKKKIIKNKVSVKNKPMMVSIILDETGSMQSRQGATISAYNEYINSLKVTKASVSVTLTKFNTAKTEIVYNDKALKDVPTLSTDTYKPDMMTNLYDAVGKTISEIQANDIDKTKSVLVVVITDGEENSSKEYTQQKIFDLIKDKQGKGWTFVFMGADQDAWKASSGLGFNKANTMSFSGSNIKGAMQSLGKSTIMYASSSLRQSGTTSSNFFTGSNTVSNNKKFTGLKRK